MVLMFVLVLQSSQLLALAAEETTELAYDDGTVDEGWRARVGADMAVRFSPPFEQTSILALKYYIHSRPTSFSAVIFDSDRKVILEKPATATSAEWLTVDVSNEKVVVKGEFYAAMKTTVTNGTYLGTDYTNPHGRSFWVTTQGAWTAYKDDPSDNGRDADFMIRAVVQTAVQPQTTITNLQYPTQAVELQNGVTQVTVTFDVGYSGLPSGGYLVFGPTKRSTGSATSTPDPCMPLGEEHKNEATCVTVPSSSSGTESASFILTFNSTGQYALAVSAVIEDASFNILSRTESDYTISVVEKPFLEAYGLYIAAGVAALVVVIVAVLLMMRRRGGRAAAPAPVTIPPAAPIPTPAPVGPTVAPPPTPALPGKFCVNCGASILATTKFCRECGSQQPVPSPPDVLGTKFCKVCAAKIPSDSKFCEKCGAELT